MFRYNVKMALRHLFKNRLNAIINIIGLAVGISASIIMFLYAANELSYNSNFDKADRIYMVYKERHLPTGIQITRDTWFPMADALKESYPAIESATHLWNEESWIQNGQNKYKLPVTYSMQNIFDVFSFPLAKGETLSFAKDINTAIISKETAHKLFGALDPVGKTITVDYETEYVIRGVFAEIPKNSTYRPQILISSKSAPWYENVKNSWGSSWLDTYVLLKKNISKESFEEQLPQFVKTKMGNESVEQLSLRLTALPDLYNETTHANTYAYILFGIALAILTIASINFMNISTAKSLEKSKEIGVQKVLGASRKQLIRRYLSESILVSFFALFAGIIFTAIFLPYFNSIYDMDLSISTFGFFNSISGLILLGLFTGMISGIYPALVITKFNPVEIISGKLKRGKGGFNLKSALIVMQFVLAIIMLAGTTIVMNQIEFMKNADLNIDKSNLMIISVQNSDFSDNVAAKQKIETFKAELRNSAGIMGVTSTSMSVPSESGSHIFVYPDDRTKEQRLRQRWIVVDESFFDVYDIKMLDGRNFSNEKPTDQDEAVVINEAALKDIGWENINKGELNVAGKNRKIIGLVKDYNYQSLESGVEPLIHIFRASESNAYRYITVRFAPGSIVSVLDFIKEKWREVDPSRPLPFHFVDESFNRLYETQDRLAVVARTFTGVALIISCLGLFALSALMLTYRTKEIGIRKVLGASISGITFQLTRDFTKWVAFSAVIAIPATWLFMDSWLQNFAYRVNMSPAVFIGSAIIVLIVAILTVYLKAIRAASANPVESLRYE